MRVFQSCFFFGFSYDVEEERVFRNDTSDRQFCPQAFLFGRYFHRAMLAINGRQRIWEPRQLVERECQLLTWALCIGPWDGLSCVVLCHLLSAFSFLFWQDVFTDYAKHLFSLFQHLRIISRLDVAGSSSEKETLEKKNEGIHNWKESYFQGALQLLSIIHNLTNRLHLFSKNLRAQVLHQKSVLFGSDFDSMSRWFLCFLFFFCGSNNKFLEHKCG